MIKYDYTIKRDEGAGEVIFEPTELPKELPNYILIEGKNARGKSTLLHLLGLGFHGISNERIAPPLIKKMKNLLSGGKNLTTFEIEITNDNNEVEIIASKKSFMDDDIIVKDGDGTLSPSEIKKKYNIIYDIPDDPINRLSEMSKEVEEIQVNIRNNSENLVTEIFTTTRDIRDARNPQKIASQKDDIKHFTKKVEDASSKIPLMEADLKLYSQYSAIKYYKICKDKINRDSEKLSKLKRTGQTIIRRERKTTKELREIEIVIRETCQGIKRMHEEVHSFIEGYFTNSLKKIVKEWGKIDVDEECKDPQYHVLLKQSAAQLKVKLQQNEGVLENDENIKKIDILQRMVELLDQLGDTQYKIPGVLISVEKLKQALNNEISLYADKRDELNGISINIKTLTELISSREKLETDLMPRRSKLIEEAEQYGQLEQFEDSNVEEVKRLEGDIMRFKASLTYYRQVLVLYEIDEDKIDSYYETTVVNQQRQVLSTYNEKSFKSKILEKNKELSAVIDSKKHDEFQLDQMKRDLASMESREPHEYHSHVDCLDKYKLRVQVIKSRMTKYSSYLKSTSESDDPEYVKYMEKLRSYLGKRMGKMRYVTVKEGKTAIEEITVSKLDLTKELIYTTDGREISFMDISSGQTHAIYLKQRLHSSDDRKIIALFDEVGMMDNETMDLLVDELKELHSRDKLLIAVIAQKKDDVASLQYSPLIEG